MAAIFQLEIQEETGDDHEQYGEASTPVLDTLGQRTIETFERITDDDDEHQEDSEFSVLPRRRVRKYKNHPKSITKPSDDDPELEADNTSESSESSEFTDEDIYSDVSQGRNESDDNEDSEIFEDYSPPGYDDEPDPPGSESTIDDRFLWILLWIMTFRTRFNITETATEALIKFMKLVLIEIGGDNFRDFPDSIYLAKKTLGLKDQFHSLVPCPKCHKLYQKQEVTNFQQNGIPAIMTCRHIEFPNSSLRNSRSCNTPLSRKIGVSANRTVIRPNLIFPFSGIRQQIATMYRRLSFESHLRYWTNQS